MRTHRPRPDLDGPTGAGHAPPDDPRGRPALEVMAGALGGYLLDLRAHEVGTLDGTDPEELHDLRVALRRARSVLWGGRRVFPAEELELLRSLLAWAARPTSAARDHDVLAADLPGLVDRLPAALQRGAGPLGRELADRRVAAHGKVVEMVTGTRWPVLVRRWDAMAARGADGGVVGGGPAGPDAGRPAGRVVGGVLDRSLRRVRRSGRAALRSDDRDEWHRLRKDLKRFRYLLAAFDGVYPPGSVDPVVRELAGLQDVLGRLQDRHVQASMLTDAGVAAGGWAAVTAGALAERLRRDEDRAHRRCHRAFRDFERSDVRAELAHLLH